MLDSFLLNTCFDFYTARLNSDRIQELLWFSASNSDCHQSYNTNPLFKRQFTAGSMPHSAAGFHYLVDGLLLHAYPYFLRSCNNVQLGFAQRHYKLGFVFPDMLHT